MTQFTPRRSFRSEITLSGDWPGFALRNFGWRLHAGAANSVAGSLR